MEVFTPQHFLLIWTLINVAVVVSTVVGLIGIYKNKQLYNHAALGWIVVVIFVPFLGSLLYFSKTRTKTVKHN